jgi:hypothetical protein
VTADAIDHRLTATTKPQMMVCNVEAARSKEILRKLVQRTQQDFGWAFR